jgi:hypothetical protein
MISKDDSGINGIIFPMISIPHPAAFVHSFAERRIQMKIYI